MAEDDAKWTTTRLDASCAVLSNDAWWTKNYGGAQQSDEAKRVQAQQDEFRRLGKQQQPRIIDAALLSAADRDACMLLRLERKRWYWGPAMSSKDVAAMLRRQCADGRVPFVAHEYLIDPARAAASIRGLPGVDDLDCVWQRPFLDIEIEPARLSPQLRDMMQSKPNDIIPLLTQCYGDAFRFAFGGLEPRCLWLTSHVVNREERRVQKASFHMVVNAATAAGDASQKVRVCFERCSTQRAFVAHFERHLAHALFTTLGWPARDVDCVVPFTHAALSVSLPGEPPKAWIDSGVYAVKHSMRLPLASKERNELRPMMPHNFAVDGADGNGGIEAACITGFDRDSFIVVLDRQQQQQISSFSRAEQCRAALGALATSFARLIDSLATRDDEDDDTLPSLLPLLEAHQECEQCLRVAMTTKESGLGKGETAVSAITALDPVLAQLRTLVEAFEAWCAQHSMQRVTLPMSRESPLPFEIDWLGSNRCKTAGPTIGNRCPPRDVPTAQRQYEWPFVLELAAEHLRVEPRNLRLSKAILYDNGAERKDTVASYIVEMAGGASWPCPFHDRAHMRRKFRININQQTGVCLLRCQGGGTDQHRRLDEVATYTMLQCTALGGGN